MIYNDIIIIIIIIIIINFSFSYSSFNINLIFILLYYIYIINYRSLATCSADNTVKIWENINNDGQFSLTKKLVGHQRWVWDCSFSADSAYLITGNFFFFIYYKYIYNRE